MLSTLKCDRTQSKRLPVGIPKELCEARAAARLECLEESKEKEALLTLVRGVTWMLISYEADMVDLLTFEQPTNCQEFSATAVADGLRMTETSVNLRGITMNHQDLWINNQLNNQHCQGKNADQRPMDNNHRFQDDG